MARTLLVDTNFSSAPICNALQQAGHEVHVIGRNPDDALAGASERYWNSDYSDTRALAETIASASIDLLVPGCTDRSYQSCTSQWGSPAWKGDSPENFLLLNDKARFREIADRLGLPVPRVYSDHGTPAKETVIVKPVDSFSGNGITVLDAADSDLLAIAARHARAASPTSKHLVEQFVQGQLYSHSAFLCKGVVVRDFIVQEDCTASPFTVDTSRVIHEGEMTPLRNDLRDCIGTLARALHLVDGLLHTQFIHDGARFWMIEITRRCPGDLYSELIEMSTGFPYAAFYAANFTGEANSVPQVQWKRFILRHTVNAGNHRGMGSIDFLQPLRLERFVPLKAVGSRFEPGAKNRAAIIFCRERSRNSLDKLYSSALDRNLYAIQPISPDGDAPR